MDLKGKVHEIGGLQQISDKFQKRVLVVEYADNPSYPEYVPFEVVNDKVSLLDSLKVGDEVQVDFNLRGRPWLDKQGVTQYFPSLQLWRVNITASGSGTPQVQPDQSNPEDDLPF